MKYIQEERQGINKIKYKNSFNFISRKIQSLNKFVYIKVINDRV